MTNKIMPDMKELQTLIANGSEDFLRQALTQMLNLMMELEVESKTKASKHERNSERKTYRNGVRPRTLSTGVGEVVLNIPKLRSGESYYPSFLEPRRLVVNTMCLLLAHATRNGGQSPCKCNPRSLYQRRINPQS